MSELRLNLLTNEWVIIAPGRALRPMDFHGRPERHPRPQHSPSCPFCLGNEGESEERFRLPDPSGEGWLTRAVLNKFPALSRSSDAPVRRGEGWRVSVDAYGAHEVIIETPRHDATLALLPERQLAHVLRTYRSRYRSLQSDPHIKHIVIFKNHGESAGTSLIHPHSQIIGTPVVSTQVRGRLSLLAEHRERRGTCLICEMLADERESGERVVHESRCFTAIIPYAALSAFHLWIFPKRCMMSFGETDDDEISDLAAGLRRILRMLHFGLGDPDFNLVIRSAPSLGPPLEAGTESFHWYVAIVPRLARAAGFELGSGMFINTSYPRESAAYLRAVDTRAEEPGEPC